MVCKYFLPVCGFILYSTVSFTEHFNFNYCQFLYGLCSRHSLKNSLSRSISTRLSSLLSSKCFAVLRFACSAEIHFQLILWKESSFCIGFFVLVWFSLVSFLPGDVKLKYHLLKSLPFLHWIVFAPLSNVSRL